VEESLGSWWDHHCEGKNKQAATHHCKSGLIYVTVVAYIIMVCF